jgi:hypothetical protein
VGAKLNSKLNGLEIGLLNVSDGDKKQEVNGVQFGIVNYQTNGKVIQIGVYNSSTKKGEIRRSLLFNYDFR